MRTFTLRVTAGIAAALFATTVAALPAHAATSASHVSPSTCRPCAH